jgi:hypothetical protein
MPLDSARIVKMQEMGSLMTFARRYQIASFFGLAAEEDDDANSADGNQVQNMTTRASKPDPRAEYKRIHDAMSAAQDATALAEIMLANKEAIMLVKNASEQGYAALMALKDKLVAGYSGEGEA